MLAKWLESFIHEMCLHIGVLLERVHTFYVACTVEEYTFLRIREDHYHIRMMRVCVALRQLLYHVKLSFYGYIGLGYTILG